MKLVHPTTATIANTANTSTAKRVRLVSVPLVWLFGALALGCGGSASQASPAVASNPSPPESENTPASAVDVTECARTAEELALALRAIASHDVPPPTAEDLLSESEWTEDLRAWNRLQSARFRSVETDGANAAAGTSGRHRVWVHALRGRTAALEHGPFEAQVEAEGGSFQAGSLDERASLTIQIVEEDGCLRIDDR